MNLALPAKRLTAAVAAFAGFSLTTVYAVPNYIPPADSPLDATTLNSVSPLLNNFNQFLGEIEAKLSGTSLATGAVAPTDKEYYAAVSAAVAANPTFAEQIVSAAVQFKPGKVRDIVRTVVFNSPTLAVEAVAGAANSNPLKAGDAAAGAIFGLIDANGSVADAEVAAAADEALILATRESIERVVKAAVASVKRSGSQSTNAVAVAETLMASFLADAASMGSNAALFLDDIGRGAMNGVQSMATTTPKPTVVAAMLAKFVGSPAATDRNVINFAMGALKGSLILTDHTSSYDNVAAALQGNAALNAATPGLQDALTVGAGIQKALRLAPKGTDEDAFAANLVGSVNTEAELYAYLSGALQAFKGRAASYVNLALTDSDVGTLSTASRQAIVSAAVTANFGATAKVVASSINASANSLSAVQAVQAAIPAANDLFSGVATLAALKTIPKASETEGADSVAVLEAAIDAAVGVGYTRSLGDIALNAAKAKKLHDNLLVAAAIARVPVGWEEAVAAFIIGNNPKESSATGAATVGSNKAAAIDAATAKAGADVASVTLAIEIAQGGKLSPKTLFDDAIEKTYANPNKARAVLFGAGAVNNRLTVPLLGMLLRLADGGDSDAALLNYAISLNKKLKLNIEMGYEAAQDAIAYPDNIFDLVDHKLLTNPKQALEIVSGVVSARPEYAHYAARAAAFRSPGTVGKTASAAILYAHMRSNRDQTGTPIASPDDPAAVAAIAAAVVLGVKDAKGLTELKVQSAMKAAISAMVKASLTFQNPALEKTDPNKKAGLVGNAATFAEANGNGSDPTDEDNFILRRTKGTAAVLTGAVAQLQVADGLGGLEGLNPLAKIAITAAAKAAKSHALALAQAAGAAAAAAAVNGSAVFGDFAGIASAFLGINGIPGLAQLENAARFGAEQFLAGTFGAGAAGIRNYGHVSGLNNPVTDISNF